MRQSDILLWNKVNISHTFDFTHSPFSFYRWKCECRLHCQNCVLEFASSVEITEVSHPESSGWASPWESHFVMTVFPLRGECNVLSVGFLGFHPEFSMKRCPHVLVHAVKYSTTKLKSAHCEWYFKLPKFVLGHPHLLPDSQAFLELLVYK